MKKSNSFLPLATVTLGSLSLFSPVYASTFSEHLDKTAEIRESSIFSGPGLNIPSPIDAFLESEELLSAEKEYHAQQIDPLIQRHLGYIYYGNPGFFTGDPDPEEFRDIIDTRDFSDPSDPITPNVGWPVIEFRFGFLDDEFSFVGEVDDFDIGFVEYSLFAGVFPDSPISFVSIGTSFDKESNFSLLFQPSPTTIEPIIRAKPFDILGNPIVISGVNGENIAEATTLVFHASIPEPTSTFSLLALGTLGAGSSLLRKRQSKSKLS